MDGRDDPMCKHLLEKGRCCLAVTTNAAIVEALAFESVINTFANSSRCDFSFELAVVSSYACLLL